MMERRWSILSPLGAAPAGTQEEGEKPMPPHVHRFALLLALLFATSGVSSAAYRGYVELPWVPTFCLQESHFLTDPCTGNPQYLLDDRGAVNMDPYLCEYVAVDGPNVGIECQIIAPQSVLVSQPPCPIPFTDLWISADTPPRVNWNHVTCAVSHDVIRGDLPGLSSGGSIIDLGRVSCLANDVPQAAWWYVTGPSDPELPPLGSAYFYLVRAFGLPSGDTTYGHSSDGQEEIPFSGDCPL